MIIKEIRFLWISNSAPSSSDGRSVIFSKSCEVKTSNLHLESITFTREIKEKR